MMKKLLFTLIMLIGVSCVYAQGTYYWVGGATAQSLTGATWSLIPGGEPVSRNNSGDILIFDNVAVEIEVNGGTNLAKLQLQNNADVTFERKSSEGGTTITLNGSSGQGLYITNGSKLRLKSAPGYNMTVVLPENITGLIDNSEVYVVGTGQTRIVTTSVGSLEFNNGSSCFVNSGASPFGNSSGSNLSANKSVIFSSGSNLIYQGGNNPFGSNSAGYILDLKTGSNFIMEANNLSNMFNGKMFGNLIIRNGVTVALNENFYNIDDLTIESGAIFNMRNTGVSPISGNIVNNGVIGINGSVSSANLLLKGTSLQTISGTGSFDNLGAITVASDADVKLETSLNIVGTGQSSVLGKLDFGLYEIRGIGTVANSGRLQFRGAVSGNTTNEAAISEGNHVVTISTTEGYSTLNPVVGLLVTGPQIPANTYVIGTSSGNRQITLSNAPTGSGTTITVSSNNPTIKTANPTGVDGSITINSNGNLNFSAGTNYIFDAATTTPFPADGNSNLGDVTFNAPATTNKNVNIAGTLTLNNSKLTIGDEKAVNMLPTASFGGTFNQNSYIVTDANTATGTSGKLVVNGISASTLVPVGTLTSYTPVTLYPTPSSTFEINVFEGITADATPNGTALSAGAKNNLVNAVWNINRTAGSGDCEVTLGWQAALEGTNFSNLANAEIGVAQYLNGAYTSYTGSGDNALNTATVVLNEFGPLSVGKIGSLPVELLSFLVQKNGASVQISWSTAAEQNNSHYDIEHSANGKIFNVIGTKAGAVNSATLQNYTFIDHYPQAGVNYYRLVQYDLNGKATVYNPQVVNISTGSVLKIYSTSSSIHVSINEDEVSRGNFMLYSADGKKLFTQSLQLNKGVNAFEVNTLDLKPGVYVAYYTNENKVITEKFIK